MHSLKRNLWIIPVLMCITSTAFAERGVPISNKPRPEYEPEKHKIGSLIVLSKMSLGLEHNDNIYASDTKEVDDTITIVSPEVTVESDWSRHSLSLVAGVDSGMYASNSDENYLDGHLLVDGRVDVQRESFFNGKAGLQRLHEERSSPDSSAAWKDPAEYTQADMDLSYKQGLGRASVTAGTGITTIDYSSVELLSGGTDDLSDRDRTMYNLNTRIAYELLPSVQPFIAGRYEWRAYDQADARRDSDGYRIGLGTGFDLGGVTTGEVFAGYMQQNYDDREDISGPWFGLNLLWNVTQLTSIQANVQSSVKETTEDNSSGINAVDAGLRIDHELLRNLLIGATFSYTRDDYQSVDLTDTVYAYGPRTKYLFNRYLSVEASYTFKTKDSTEVDREYDENVFLLSVTGKY